MRKVEVVSTLVDRCSSADEVSWTVRWTRDVLDVICWLAVSVHNAPSLRHIEMPY